MKRTATSIKGEEVDFDLFEIKNQINNSPKTDDVVERERFIDKKRRRTSRKIDEVLAKQAESRNYAKAMIDNQRQARVAAQNDSKEEDAAKIAENVETAQEIVETPAKPNRRINR